MYMYIQSNGMPRGLAQFGDGVQLSLCACSGTQNLRSLQNSDVHALPHCASKIARTAGTTLSVGHKPGMLTRIRGSRTRTTTRTSIPVINSPQWAKSGTSKNKMPTTISRMVYGEQGSSQGRVAPDRVPLPEDWKDVTLLASVHVWRMTIQSVKLGGDSSKRLNSTGPWTSAGGDAGKGLSRALGVGPGHPLNRSCQSTRPTQTTTRSHGISYAIIGAAFRSSSVVFSSVTDQWLHADAPPPCPVHRCPSIDPVTLVRHPPPSAPPAPCQKWNTVGGGGGCFLDELQ